MDVRPISHLFLDLALSVKSENKLGLPFVVYHGSLSPKPYLGTGTHFGTQITARKRLSRLMQAQLMASVNVSKTAYIFPAILKINNPITFDDCWFDYNVGAAIESISFYNKGLFTDKELQMIKEPLMWGKYHTGLPMRGNANLPFSEVKDNLKALTHIPLPAKNLKGQTSQSDKFFEETCRSQLATIRLIECLESRGIDGIKYENCGEGGGLSWIAFREQQVLSLPFRLRYTLEDHLSNFPGLVTEISPSDRKVQNDYDELYLSLEKFAVRFRNGIKSVLH